MRRLVLVLLLLAQGEPAAQAGLRSFLGRKTVAIRARLQASRSVLDPRLRARLIDEASTHPPNPLDAPLGSPLRTQLRASALATLRQLGHDAQLQRWSASSGEEVELHHLEAEAGKRHTLFVDAHGLGMRSPDGTATRSRAEVETVFGDVLTPGLLHRSVARSMNTELPRGSVDSQRMPEPLKARLAMITADLEQRQRSQLANAPVGSLVREEFRRGARTLLARMSKDPLMREWLFPGHGIVLDEVRDGHRAHQLVFDGDGPMLVTRVAGAQRPTSTTRTWAQIDAVFGNRLTPAGIEEAVSRAVRATSVPAGTGGPDVRQAPANRASPPGSSRGAMSDALRRDLSEAIGRQKAQGTGVALPAFPSSPLRKASLALLQRLATDPVVVEWLRNHQREIVVDRYEGPLPGTRWTRELVIKPDGAIVSRLSVDGTAAERSWPQGAFSRLLAKLNPIERDFGDRLTPERIHSGLAAATSARPPAPAEKAPTIPLKIVSFQTREEALSPDPERAALLAQFKELANAPTLIGWLAAQDKALVIARTAPRTGVSHEMDGFADSVLLTKVGPRLVTFRARNSTWSRWNDPAQRDLATRLGTEELRALIGHLEAGLAGEWTSFPRDWLTDAN